MIQPAPYQAPHTLPQLPMPPIQDKDPSSLSSPSPSIILSPLSILPSNGASLPPIHHQRLQTPITLHDLHTKSPSQPSLLLGDDKKNSNNGGKPQSIPFTQLHQFQQQLSAQQPHIIPPTHHSQSLGKEGDGGKDDKTQVSLPLTLFTSFIFL